MYQLQCRSRDHVYHISIAASGFDSYISKLLQQHPGQFFCIVDSALWDMLTANKLFELSEKINFMRFSPSESHKSIESYLQIIKYLHLHKCQRDSILVSIGGGICNDLVGFVAASFLRGLRWYSIPTTLLSQVDASVGAKVGLNYANIKNLLGFFYAPCGVYIDVSLLKTLPQPTFVEGLSEVVKHALLDSVAHFRWLEANVSGILSLDEAILMQMIVRSLKVKLALVETDELESNLRQHLNLGHTFAHALEVASQHQITHGAAVSIGLVWACKFAVRYCQACSQLVPQVTNLLYNLGLPLTPFKVFKASQLLQSMQYDKKHRHNSLTLILPKAIGNIEIANNIMREQLVEFIQNVGSEVPANG